MCSVHDQQQEGPFVITETGGHTIISADSSVEIADDQVATVAISRNEEVKSFNHEGDAVDAPFQPLSFMGFTLSMMPDGSFEIERPDRSALLINRDNDGNVQRNEYSAEERDALGEAATASIAFDGDKSNAVEIPQFENLIEQGLKELISR